MTLLRSLLLGAALLLSASTASAQLIPSFGVAGGLNFGSLSDAASADLESSTGYHIGVFVQAGLGSLAVRPGLFYNRTGELEIPSGSAFDEAAITYISIPVDLIYEPFPTPVIKPYVLAGPEFRIATGDFSDAVFGNDDEVVSFTTALDIGVGARFDALIGPKVFGELRYVFDLSGFSEGDDTVKVNVVMLRVGLGI